MRYASLESVTRGLAMTSEQLRAMSDRAVEYAQAYIENNMVTEFKQPGVPLKAFCIAVIAAGMTEFAVKEMNRAEMLKVQE